MVGVSKMKYAPPTTIAKLFLDLLTQQITMKQDQEEMKQDQEEMKRGQEQQGEDSKSDAPWITGQTNMGDVLCLAFISTQHTC